MQSLLQDVDICLLNAQGIHTTHDSIIAMFVLLMPTLEVTCIHNNAGIFIRRAGQWHTDKRCFEVEHLELFSERRALSTLFEETSKPHHYTDDNIQLPETI